MSVNVEKLFLDIVEVKRTVYECGGQVPLIMSDNAITGHIKSNIFSPSYEVNGYVYSGPFTYEYYIQKYEELFRFKIHGEICSVGVLYKKMVEIGNRHKKSEEKGNFIREPYSIAYYDKSIDTFNVNTKNKSMTTSENKVDFYTLFYPKSSAIQEFYSDPELLALLNSVNFNHVVTSIMDYYNITDVAGTSVTPEELGIYRTTTEDGKAIFLSDEKLAVMEGKILSVLKDNFKINAKLWDDSDLNKLQERKIEVDKSKLK